MTGLVRGLIALEQAIRGLSTMIKTNLSQILFAAAFTCLLVSGYLPPFPDRILSLMSGLLVVSAIVAWIRSDAGTV